MTLTVVVVTSLSRGDCENAMLTIESAARTGTPCSRTAKVSPLWGLYQFQAMVAVLGDSTVTYVTRTYPPTPGMGSPRSPSGLKQFA